MGPLGFCFQTTISEGSCGLIHDVITVPIRGWWFNEGLGPSLEGSSRPTSSIPFIIEHSRLCKLRVLLLMGCVNEPPDYGEASQAASPHDNFQPLPSRDWLPFIAARRN